MTYRELKKEIDALTDEQLDQTVEVVGESSRIKPLELVVLKEDQVNPSGECWEDISSYSGDEDFADEEIVAKAGDVYLM